MTQPHLQKSAVFLALLFFFFQSTAFSFDLKKGNIVGKVLDDTQSPLYPATVVLYLAGDGSFVKGATTTEEGTYTFVDVPSGEYWLSVGFVGFETHETEPFTLESGATFEVDTIIMSVDALSLGQVSVEAERDLIEVQPDKTVLNVQGTVNAAGNTALELLRKSPGVVGRQQRQCYS